MPRYNPAILEPKWQQYWEQQRTFATPELPVGEKLYVLDMFPYPSGEGLHVGHPEGYTATDITCRFARMRGKCVLHPMGFDSFGLPAEEHAIKHNVHPKVNTDANIANFRRQLKMLGFSYDWDRELATTDIEYVRWTQWIFLLLFDTWFDEQTQCGRPIAELPIPPDVAAAGDDAVRRYRDDHRLAYQSEALVNWCPALGTVLANEEVIDGKSERGAHPVERRPLRQWMLRITAYAERLERDLDLVKWPDSTKKLQSDWIGRSTGAEVDFFLGAPESFAAWKAARSAAGFPRKPGDDVLRIYTTRPDTLFGATYMVIAPEHPFVERLTTAAQRDAVQAYCQKAAAKSDRERQEDAKTKTGVFSGAYAVNPVNGQPVPIWIADYVLASYGTGAIMAVPAHDERDYAFAKQFSLPIVAVVDPGEAVDDEQRVEVLAGRTCFAGVGRAVHSGAFDGLATDDVKARITRELAAAGLGRQATNFKLRDWLFSRQRFWGEPFPLLHEVDGEGRFTGAVRGVPEDQLPVVLPHLEDYKPHGRPEPLLAKAGDEWLFQTVDGRRYRRETNTMPQWAGSCWYYLRFIDPRNDQVFVDREKEQAWMPVDLYMGGAEHAVLHLLYSRFWHKVLFDRGYVSTPEPFRRLVHQGMILGEIEFTGYQLPDGQWVSSAQVDEDADGRPIVAKSGPPGQVGLPATPVKLPAESVEKSGDTFVLKAQPSIRIDSRAHKMSKSRGNVVNPDLIVREYGADSLRLYEMFMGPLEAVKPWSMSGVSGVRNFLDRVWRLVIDDRAEELTVHAAVQDVEPTREQNQVLHRTIFAVTRDTEGLEFNTAIARMMEFVNFFTKETVRPRSALERFVLLLAPYAPHLAEELWEALGHNKSLAYEPWPLYDEPYLKDDTVEIPVQILGKLRGKVVVAADADAATLEAAARVEPRIAELLAGKQIVKVVVVPGRLVNFVVK
ncbi:MAG: leucine--tRNA ligase [Pirellulales bacterium]